MNGLFNGVVLLWCFGLVRPMAILQEEFPSRERYSFFDIEMFKVLSESEPGNFFISPVSIKLLLGLVLEGAVGPTAEEIQVALRLPKEAQSRRNEFRIWLSMLQMKESSKELRLATRIFLSDLLHVRPEYRNAMKSFYGTDVTTVKFNESEKTRRTINDWVSNETSNLITSIVGEGQIDAKSKLMLVSAVYFKLLWETPFTKDRRLLCFYTSPGACQKTPTMSATRDFEFGYVDKLDAQALKIPYKGGKHFMLILLPSKRNKIDELSRDLVHVSIKSILSGLTNQEVFVQIPNFEISYAKDLVETLQKLQLIELFGGKANFSNIFSDGEAGLAVDKIFHSAKIKVNEGGTEAAAATGALFMPLMGGTTTSFVANHPFLFFILDSVSKSILFAGRLMTPEKLALEDSLNAGSEMINDSTHPNLSAPSSDATFGKIPSYFRPPRPKFRSIKGAFPQKKQQIPTFSVSQPSKFHGFGPFENYLPFKPEYVSHHQLFNEEKAKKQPVEPGRNELMKADNELAEVPSNKPTSDSWRHHILFFS